MSRGQRWMRELREPWALGDALTPNHMRGIYWYPLECCHAQDCAPVQSWARLVSAGGGVSQLIVTSKHGTAIVPNDLPVRESKDSRMHVCMRRDLDYVEVICLFMPPGV